MTAATNIWLDQTEYFFEDLITFIPFQITQTVPVRILSEVQQKQSGAGTAPGEMHVASSTGNGDLSPRGHFRVRSGRQRQQIVLPKSVPVSEAIP